ncbi:hypothetical protein [Salinispora arenicola]|uniref:hypothetical protein n=1 Tax=Salinispora arenicola TaxID=168697 RepID=UPI0016A0397B|nr:hypothetical protein [Salinispora arenicola]NIL57446.1 hypothetical protein [Salinispora arenicola]NIL62352.1 hypothetical protein [Salinispora arenicola]
MTTKVGVFLHSRHLETEAWEDLVLGLPMDDRFGDMATLAREVLTLGQDHELTCIVIGGGSSHRDGISEGEYTKRYLLANLARLEEFPRLKPLLDRLSGPQRAAFDRAVHDIIVTPQVRNTVAEIEAAAGIFAAQRVDRVLQIAAASHAPRCLKEQSVARSHGRIAREQQWYAVATEMTYGDTQPEDVCVIEPLHRRDQPMTFVRPGFSEVIAPYFFLPDADKKALVATIAEFMAARDGAARLPR